VDTDHSIARLEGVCPENQPTQGKEDPLGLSSSEGV